MARKVTYDQEKVKELRMKIILDSLEVLNGADVKKWSEYRKALMLRYAPNILPRLNAGKDDDKDLIPSPLVRLNEICRDNSTQEDSTTE